MRYDKNESEKTEQEVRAMFGTIVDTGDFLEAWDNDKDESIAQYDKRSGILYHD